MIYERIFKEFYESKLSYALIGGLAVNLYGYNRLTGDLDIILDLRDENVKNFIKIVSSLGFVPRLPVSIQDFALAEKRKELVEEKQMKVFTVYNPKNPLELVDVKIDDPNQIDNYLKTSEIIKMPDFEISLISFENLIKMKKEAGRARDLNDVKALERIKEEFS